MPKKKLNLFVTMTILALMIALSASVAMAQGDGTFDAPEIYKSANVKKLRLGEPVQFTIVVVNPNDPVTGSTWYNVKVTDNVDPALHIDDATSTMGTATITDHQVVVNGGITLPPGDEFVIVIYCTLRGPITKEVLYNTATLEYTDEDGNPQPPLDVDDPVEIIIEEEVPPVVPEASTLILMGSAASGLIGYAGLQIRARKRKRS